MRGNMLHAEDRAVKALGLFGDEAQDRAREKLGSPGLLQEWHKVATFDVEGAGLSSFGVVVNAQHAVFDLSVDSCNVGLLWDDATILEAAPVELQSGGLGEQAGSHVFRVNTIRGNTLEVWASGFDSFGSARLVDRSEIPAIEEKAQEQSKDNAKPPTPNDLGAGAVGPILAIALVVIVLAYAAPLLLRRGAA